MWIGFYIIIAYGIAFKKKAFEVESPFMQVSKYFTYKIAKLNIQADEHSYEWSHSKTTFGNNFQQNQKLSDRINLRKYLFEKIS